MVQEFSDHLVTLVTGADEINLAVDKIRAEIHDRKGRISRGERPSGQNKIGSLYQRATDW